MVVMVDRINMANSFDVHVPFLDHVLVKFVSTILLEQRFLRWHFTMADLLPPEILNQPKHGFTTPLTAWFRGDLAAFVANVFLSQEARQSGYFDSSAIEKSLSKPRQGTPNLGKEIWSLLIFELWRQQVMS